MNMEKIYRQPKRINFIKQGLDKLKQELAQIQETRPAAVKELSRAREMGDLSENGLYHAAKARLRSMDSRINRIIHMIKVADVQEAPKNTVGIGSKVVVEQDGEKFTYSIVGDYEAKPFEKKISANSPIGRALVSKKTGETAVFETPKGKISLKILEIK